METLNQLVSRIADNFLPVAVRNNSFFVNEVPSTLTVDHNQSWVSSVVANLFASVVNNAWDTCIRVSAKAYGYVIVMEIQESGAVSSYAMACDLQQVQALAEKIGGTLNISLNNHSTTTIAFSFPNLPLAA